MRIHERIMTHACSVDARVDKKSAVIFVTKIVLCDSVCAQRPSNSAVNSAALPRTIAKAENQSCASEDIL